MPVLAIQRQNLILCVPSLCHSPPQRKPAPSVAVDDEVELLGHDLRRALLRLFQVSVGHVAEAPSDRKAHTPVLVWILQGTVRWRIRRPFVHVSRSVVLEDFVAQEVAESVKHEVPQIVRVVRRPAQVERPKSGLLPLASVDPGGAERILGEGPRRQAGLSVLEQRASRAVVILLIEQSLVEPKIALSEWVFHIATFQAECWLVSNVTEKFFRQKRHHARGRFVNVQKNWY
mmetsp:Transcript_28203/g.62962  ORF Transcript_28203/g.62962 Transcript_28203/m.62962 type:complete len:231 (-) Transcript_28203:983-1675(-)